MKEVISAAAYKASQAMTQEGLSNKRSHIAEVMAALLGYQTFAAMSVEEVDESLEYHLGDAEIIVLNTPLAERRAQQLSFVGSLQHCMEALSDAIGVPAFNGVADFFDGHARELLEDTISEGENVSMATADSNATFSDAPDIEMSKDSGDLWNATLEWSIEATGTLVGEYDPDGDRLYNGDTMDVWGKLTYYKAGRAGLIFMDSDEGASADDSWREMENDSYADNT